MLRVIWTVTIACAFAVSVFAQDPTSQYKPAPKADTAKTFTVTGCLQAGADASTFTLTNVKSAQAAAKPAETPAAPEAVGTAGAAKTYELVAKEGVNLTPHVGHQVEITASPAPAAGRADTPGAPETAAPAAGAKPKAQRVTVSAIKHISPSCTM